jgi:clan AA aspartic protease
MDIWTGFLDKSGSPALKISISGPIPNSEQEFDAVIDTGFTGFVSMPLLKAFPLGLLLYGTTEVTLADGSNAVKLTAKGAVKIGGRMEIGVIILEPSSGDVLLGMDFLTKFERVLFVHRGKQGIMLMAEKEFDALAAERAKQVERRAAKRKRNQQSIPTESEAPSDDSTPHK